MKEYTSIAEWLEAHGNPKHCITHGEGGSMVIAVDDSNSLENGITVFSFREYHYEGFSSLWMSTGWGIRREYLAAIQGFLNDKPTENKTGVAV